MMEGCWQATFILPLVHYHRWKYTSQAKTVCLSSPINIACSQISIIASCRECTISVPQDNSAGQGNATQGNLIASFHNQEDDPVSIDIAPLSKQRKQKTRKRQWVSLSGVQGNLSKTHGQSAAMVTHKAKGKGAQKTIDANHSSQERGSDKFSREHRNQGAESRMFAGVAV